jgi:hypothetical protein
LGEGAGEGVVPGAVLSKKEGRSLKRVQYKGYEIHAVPFLSGLSRKWEINIYVSVDRGHHVEMANYRADHTCDSEEEAVQECFLHGKKIVDEKTSVSDRYLIHS